MNFIDAVRALHEGKCKSILYNGHKYKLNEYGSLINEYSGYGTGLGTKAYLSEEWVLEGVRRSTVVLSQNLWYCDKCRSTSNVKKECCNYMMQPALLTREKKEPIKIKMLKKFELEKDLLLLANLDLFYYDEVEL